MRKIAVIYNRVTFETNLLADRFGSLLDRVMLGAALIIYVQIIWKNCIRSAPSPFDNLRKTGQISRPVGAKPYNWRKKRSSRQAKC